nr:RNA-directed DNA polymerase, eukaryota, reverse transcriptase zinc-binding domain protein [Tanacetum cinerariifolium]
MITSTWNSFTLVDSNGMIRFKKKLQLLKKVILKWVAEYKSIHLNSIRDVKNKLSDIDKLLDKGRVTDDVLLSREWVDDPICVKDEFRNHFTDRFNDPGTRHARINFSFPNRLTLEQVSILEASVLDEEISKAVWGCGENKSPGMTVNLKKSHILGLGIRRSTVSEAAASLGCSVMKTPFNYLGIMVGGNMYLVKSWDETIHKLTKRLSKWKVKTLSIGGRLTLLKSVLGSTPIYNMSIFKVPETVLKKMENLRRNFFNGIQEGDQKITWVKWHTILASKKFGGLGVYSFFALN